jgi:SAM-dependent methyltransferase
MTEADNHEINVEELMAEIRDGLERRQSVPGEAPSVVAPSCQPVPEAAASMPAPLYLAPFAGASPFIPKETGYHLDDFLQYHDIEFVRNAYLGILGREPDPGSYAIYLENLRQGKMTKIEILGRLRYALEGRNKAAPIKGLFLRFCAHTLYRIPVLGYLAQLMSAVILFPKVIGGLRKLEGSFGAQVSGFRNHMDEVTEALAATLNGVIGYESALEQLISGKAERSDVQASLLEWAGIKMAQAELQSSVDRLNLSKADRAEVQSVLVELKSSKVDLLEFRSAMADLRLLATDRTEMQTALAALNSSKADRPEFVATVEELRSSKADRIELERVASQKADHEDLVAIGCEIAQIQRQIRDHRNNIVDQQRRIMLLMERMRAALPEPVAASQVRKTLPMEDQLLYAMYASMEDEFKGTREDIKESQRLYLPYLRKLEGGTQAGQLLDVGCGRGEWLELLEEEGIHARGIDLNPILVEQCQARGLDAIEADALTYLRSQPDLSLRAITGFHTIEHFPFVDIIKFLNEAFRLLRRGGVLILETPNPQNLIVGSWSFHLDPTHVRPLPSVLMGFVAEAQGFCGVEILELNPFPEFSLVPESGPVAKLNEYIYGPRDYAVIGYKA